jgi:5-methylcytosine-specific restriction endonuclease McrA
MPNIDFSFRLNCAFRYHDFLSRNSHGAWLDALCAIENDVDAGIPEVMVLLHPKWYEELSFHSLSDPRGVGSFSSAGPRAKCRSYELWGYECPYEDSKIHIDHTFPYARGGATKDDNAMYLCKEHNLSKSTDLHLIPWESFVNRQWILDELKVFLIMGQRLTASRLYLPKVAMSKA